MGIVNSIIALLIDESQVCQTLGGSLFPGSLSCGDCNAVIVQDDPSSTMVKFSVEATCSLDSVVDVTLAGESDSINFWEALPFFGGIGAFDPFTTSLTISPTLPGAISGSFTVESENVLFANPPTTTVTAVTGSVETPLGPVACTGSGSQLSCGNVACFDATTLAFTAGPC